MIVDVELKCLAKQTSNTSTLATAVVVGHSFEKDAFLVWKAFRKI